MTRITNTYLGTMNTPIHEGKSLSNSDLDQVIDPVCGMVIDPLEVAITQECSGDVLYFCSHNCLDEFNSHPQDFINTSPESTDNTDAAAERSEGEAGVAKDRD